MISILSRYFSILKKIWPTSRQSDTSLWYAVLPSSEPSATILKARFTKSILAKGEGIDVISCLSFAPIGSAIESIALVPIFTEVSQLPIVSAAPLCSLKTLAISLKTYISYQLTIL